MKKCLPIITLLLSACGSQNFPNFATTPTVALQSVNLPGYNDRTLVRTLEILPQDKDGQSSPLYRFDSVKVMRGVLASEKLRPITPDTAFSFVVNADVKRFTLHFNQENNRAFSTVLHSGAAKTSAQQAMKLLRNLTAMIESDSPFERWNATLSPLTASPNTTSHAVGGALAEFSLMDYARYGAWSAQFAPEAIAATQTRDESGDTVYVGFYHYGLRAAPQNLPLKGNANYAGHGFGLASDGRLVAGAATLNVNFSAATAQLTLLALNISETANPLAATPLAETPWYDSIIFAPSSILGSSYVGEGAAFLSERPTTLPLASKATGRVTGNFYGPAVLRGGNPEESAGTWELNAGGAVLRGAFGVELAPPPIGESVDADSLTDAFSSTPRTALLRFDTLLMLHERRSPERTFTALDGEGWFSLKNDESKSPNPEPSLFSFIVHDFTNDVALQFVESNEALPENELSSQSAAELYLVRTRAHALEAGIAADSMVARRLFADNAAAKVPAAGGSLRVKLAYAAYGIWGVDPRRLGADAQTKSDVGGIEDIQLGFYHTGLPTPTDDIPRKGNAVYEGVTIGGGAGVVISGTAQVSADFDNASVVLRLSDLLLENVSGFEDEAEKWYESITFPKASLNGAFYESADSDSGNVSLGSAPPDSPLSLQGNVRGVVRGALYGTHATTGGPAESAGVWGLEDAAKQELRGVFGGALSP